MEKVVYLGSNNKTTNLPLKIIEKDFEVMFAPLTRAMCEKPLKIPRGDVWILDMPSYPKQDTRRIIEVVIQAVRSSLIPMMVIIKEPFENKIGSFPNSIWGNPLIEVVSPLFPPMALRNSLNKLILFSRQVVVTAELEVENRYLKEQTKEAENRMEKLVLENDTLLQEVHHRVKNNLQIVSSILSLKTSESNSAEIKDILQITQSRVDAISLIHKKLYESSDFSEIDMKNYFQQQLMDLFYTYPVRSKNINLDLVVSPFSLIVARAIHCAQLVNELVVNVFLHAFPGESSGNLKVHFRKKNTNMISLTVEDDGVGLKDDVDVLSNQSIGLRLVFQLVKQLNGTIETFVSDGTHFTVCFPL